ncbi:MULTISPECIES: M20 metallopeptidase family protein [Dethiosulfovibrio]|uniref:M20 family metallopeptidase n=2 Tax=Dethiosulfovibrio TaxID=47054 RepID=A0ABS9EQS4_9BACT|nr:MULTISPECIES: M20 family metallopeptidase [Dethiosulfovibrio]MCF4113186.1 M20 family metallopeptidase [Dethiosulfovibrio russensis]MCF4142250.1 M20 family metallopeptidase [Dethiosulfovibrio marinus]MCF4144558.1 M20 family metallopeptidase [Dethiosulfovibrio acidaminovorans]
MGKVPNLSNAVIDEKSTTWLEDIYKKIHRHPELGMQEFQTTVLIKSIMDDLGVERIDLPGMDVGAACVIRGGKNGPTLALRADMDALPILEKTSLEYASENTGIMHACGHDFNTTVMLGVLKKTVEKYSNGNLRGNLKFIFQPAEETLEGAKRMIEAGILDNPGVDMIMMSHGDPDINVGQIALFKGYSHANSDNFSIELTGSGGHGSRPFQTQDLILAGSHLVSILQSIVSRDIDARDPAVISVCSFNAGNTFNVLPGSAKLTGTVRTLSDTVQSRIIQRMQETCDSLSSLFHIEAKLDYRVGVPSCVIDDDVEKLIRDAALRHLPEESIISSPTRMGGEDFAFYSRRVPAGVVRIGVTSVGSRKRGSTHSSTFQVDLAAIPVGVTVLSQVVDDFLSSEE